MILINFVLAEGPNLGILGAAYLYNQQQGALRQAQNRPTRKNIYDSTAFADKQKQSFSKTHHMFNVNDLDNTSPSKPNFAKPTQNTLPVPDDINSSTTSFNGICLDYSIIGLI